MEVWNGIDNFHLLFEKLYYKDFFWKNIARISLHDNF